MAQEALGSLLYDLDHDCLISDVTRMKRMWMESVGGGENIKKKFFLGGWGGGGRGRRGRREAGGDLEGKSTSFFLCSVGVDG